MALRAVIEHPKFFRLKQLLRVNKSCALGYLEGLWHFCGRYTPAGNIGKYSDAEIEAWLEWDGEEGALVAAYVKAGWLDVNEAHRLIVHDWHQHADDATRKAVHRAKLVFVGMCLADVPTESEEGNTVSGLPEPVPEPVPEPEAGEVPALPFVPVELRPAKAIREVDLELVYAAYPRQIGKAKALEKIRAAVLDLGTGKRWPALVPAEALVFLLAKVQVFARSPSGQQGEYTPHPATWFHQARYLDDENEWQRGKEGDKHANRGQQRTDGNVNAAREALAAIGNRQTVARAG